MRLSHVVVPVMVASVCLVLILFSLTIRDSGPLGRFLDVHPHGWRMIDHTVSDGAVTFQANDMMTQKGNMFVVYSLNMVSDRSDQQALAIGSDVEVHRLVDDAMDLKPIDDYLVADTETGSIRIASLGSPIKGSARYGIELTGYRSDDPGRSMSINLFLPVKPDDPSYLALATTTLVPPGAVDLVAIRHDAGASDRKWIEIVDHTSGTTLAYFQLGPGAQILPMSSEEFTRITLENSG